MKLHLLLYINAANLRFFKFSDPYSLNPDPDIKLNADPDLKHSFFQVHCQEYVQNKADCFML